MRCSERGHRFLVAVVAFRILRDGVGYGGYLGRRSKTMHVHRTKNLHALSVGKSK